MADIIFKKPGRSIRRRENKSDSDDEDGNALSSSAIEETLELQRARRRPCGVNIEDLAILKPKVKESASKADPMKQKTGGFIDIKTLKRELSEETEQIGTSFASETNRQDVDLPMLTYIEENLAKRRGVASKEDEPVVEKQRNPEDALYDLPEHIKALTKTVKKEETMSSSMLSGIPEVDLGIEAKIRNIEATEEAKQRLMQERLKRRDQVSVFVPTNVAVNFVQHNRFNIEDHQPRARQAAPTPKPTPLRVGDAERPKTLAEEVQPSKPGKAVEPGRPVEKATDDFHFEKFKKFNRRF